MAVTGSIQLANNLVHTESLDLSTPREVFSNTTFKITSGTGDDQMDQIWHDSRSIGTTKESINLQGDGSGDVDPVDAFGTTLDFAEVRFFYVRNNHASNTLLIGGDMDAGGAGDDWNSWLGADQQWVKLPPDSMMCIYVGNDGAYSVSAGNDMLYVKGSGASTTYDIYIGGVSA